MQNGYITGRWIWGIGKIDGYWLFLIAMPAGISHLVLLNIGVSYPLTFSHSMFFMVSFCISGQVVFSGNPLGTSMIRISKEVEPFEPSFANSAKDSFLGFHFNSYFLICGHSVDISWDNPSRQHSVFVLFLCYVPKFRIHRTDSIIVLPICFLPFSGYLLVSPYWIQTFNNFSALFNSCFNIFST